MSEIKQLPDLNVKLAKEVLSQVLYPIFSKRKEHIQSSEGHQEP
jgi:hypothetical protein